MITNKCYISPILEQEFGFSVYRVDNDINGNPRYVIHFLAFADNYDKAKTIANGLGFKVYRARWFGGGFVGQSYNLENTIEQIIEAQKQGKYKKRGDK